MCMLAEIDKAAIPDRSGGGDKPTSGFGEVLARVLRRRGR